MKCQHLSVNVHWVFLVIQDILTVKIERNIYVNEEKTVSEIQILINKTFLLFFHHELLMSFINIINNVFMSDLKTRWEHVIRVIIYGGPKGSITNQFTKTQNNFPKHKSISQNTN